MRDIMCGGKNLWPPGISEDALIYALPKVISLRLSLCLSHLSVCLCLNLSLSFQSQNNRLLDTESNRISHCKRHIHSHAIILGKS